MKHLKHRRFYVFVLSIASLIIMIGSFLDQFFDIAFGLILFWGLIALTGVCVFLEDFGKEKFLASLKGKQGARFGEVVEENYTVPIIGQVAVIDLLSSARDIIFIAEGVSS